MNFAVTNTTKRDIVYPILLRNISYPDVIVLAVAPGEGENRFSGLVVRGQSGSGLDTGMFYPSLGHYAFTIADDVTITIKN